MLTFSTLEIRWFLQGQVPAEVEAWFLHLNPQPIRQPPRTDQYLCQTGGGSVGIKLRDGRIEIKERRQRHGATQLHPQVLGMLEEWCKWSFAIAGSGRSLSEMLATASSWTSVWKERWLRRYYLTDDHSITTPPDGEWPVQGIDFEITRLRVRDQHWWTLGLEAFGQTTYLRQNLLRVAAIVLSGELPLVLTPEDSRAYPEWLNTS